MGHGAKHGTMITVIMIQGKSQHGGSQGFRGLVLGPVLRGSDTGSKQTGISLGPMRPGNWALGREDCPALWVRAGRGAQRERGSMCVYMYVCICVQGKQIHMSVQGMWHTMSTYLLCAEFQVCRSTCGGRSTWTASGLCEVWPL